MKKNLAPQKRHFWVGVYTVENKDKKRDYQGVVRVVDQE